MSLDFDVGYAWEILPELLAATVVTVRIAVLGFGVALAAGLVLAVARLSTVPGLRQAAVAYVELVRLTPLLVQLFFLFYVLPEYGLTLSPQLTGVLALGLNYAAYTSEVYRAGIVSVPRGQWEAARALNLGTTDTWRRVILPQALPPMVPALGNYLIFLFKDVPLLATITVYELLNTANLLASQSFHYLEALTLVGLIFFLLSYPSSIAVRQLDRHLAGRRTRAPGAGRLRLGWLRGPSAVEGDRVG